jgi:hypothetical protein
MAYLQQARVLEQDVTEEEAIADAKPLKAEKPKRQRLMPKPAPTPAGVKVTRTTLKDYSQNKDRPAPSSKRKKR